MKAVKNHHHEKERERESKTTLDRIQGLAYFTTMEVGYCDHFESIITISNAMAISEHRMLMVTITVVSASFTPKEVGYCDHFESIITLINVMGNYNTGC